MMKMPSVDEMLLGKQSRYSLVIAVAKRAREIASEAELKGEVLVEKPVNMAIEDFRQHKYDIVEKKDEENK